MANPGVGAPLAMTAEIASALILEREALENLFEKSKLIDEEASQSIFKTLINYVQRKMPELGKEDEFT